MKSYLDDVYLICFEADLFLYLCIPWGWFLCYRTGNTLIYFVDFVYLVFWGIYIYRCVVRVWAYCFCSCHSSVFTLILDAFFYNVMIIIIFSQQLDTRTIIVRFTSILDVIFTNSKFTITSKRTWQVNINHVVSILIFS